VSAAIHWITRASWKHGIRRQAKCSGAGIRNLCRDSRDRRPGRDGGDAARRRHDLDDRHLRPGAAFALLDNRQSESGACGDARKGDNLWTCSIVALDPATGKLQWAFQPSPHDTHDWDAVQTPVLFDGEFKGERRKMLAQASRNGYFFVLDRKTGKNLVTAPFMRNNWSKGVDASGGRFPTRRRSPPEMALCQSQLQRRDELVSTCFRSREGLFYVNASQNYSVFYYTAEGKPEGYAGRTIFWRFQAYCWLSTGRQVKCGGATTSAARGDEFWRLLSTAGNILFAGDTSGT